MIRSSTFSSIWISNAEHELFSHSLIVRGVDCPNLGPMSQEMKVSVHLSGKGHVSRNALFITEFRLLSIMLAVL
jgi:hypothetical protein